MAHYIGNKIYWRRDNAFSKEFLQKVDEIAKQKKLVDLKIHGKEGMNTIRDSKGCFLNDKYLIDNITPAINQANEECMWHFKLKKFEDFQYTTYGVGHHYGWHQDTHTHAYRDQTVRKVSFTLCLNDEYTGGELEICEPHPDPKKTKFYKFDKITPGTIIIFYSGLWHRVLPVKTGFRKSLVGWTLGTKFQ